MTLEFDTAWPLAVLLASMRLAALLAFTPLLGGGHAPAPVRITVVLALTASLLAALPGTPAVAPVGTPGFVLAAMVELAIGAAMAFGLHCAFGAMSFAGKLLDMQVGLGVGAFFDPVTRAASPLLGTLLTTLATALFYAMEGHHLLLRVLGYSFERLPPGRMPQWPDAAPFIDTFGAMFALGLTLALPVVAALLLVDVGLAILSRTLPQMNVLLVGLPVKIAAGLTLFALSLQAMVPVVRRGFDSAFALWRTLLG